MRRARHACVIRVTLRFKGIRVGTRRLGPRRLSPCVFYSWASRGFFHPPQQPRLMCVNMSDVRLSNASPTLERVDARQQDNHRPPVRRNLYGRPDPLDIQRNLAAVEREEVQDFRDRYNFDPVTDTPLPGRLYEWEEDSDAPEFYRRAHHGGQRPQRDAEAAAVEVEAEAAGDRQREDAAQRRETQPRKRPRTDSDSGPCSAECQPKRSHTDKEEDDDDEDEEQPGGAGRARAPETRTRPESSAGVQ